MKIIPAIDLMGGSVVRLYKGDPKYKVVYGDNPVEFAKRWESAGADMLHLVDLDATLGLGSNLGVIKEILGAVSVPVEVAGGLRDRSLILEMAGLAARVVLGTVAFRDRVLLESLLLELGPQKIVVSVDHKDGEIVTHGWQKGTGVKLIPAVKDFLGKGFTEFLLTSVGRDGTMEGPELEFLEQTCALPNANMIASGGVSGINDVKAVAQKNAFGVILGKALYEGKVTVEEAVGLS